MGIGNTEQREKGRHTAGGHRGSLHLLLAPILHSLHGEFEFLIYLIYLLFLLPIVTRSIVGLGYFGKK
jgi:hypothetical protein